MLEYYLIAFLAVVLTAVSQTLVKAGSVRWNRKSIAGLYLNPFTLAGYALFILVTLLSLFALQYIPLKSMVFLQPFALIGVMAAAKVIFKEDLSRRALAGAILIIIGVAVFNL